MNDKDRLESGYKAMVMILKGITWAITIFYVAGFAQQVLPLLGDYGNITPYIEAMLYPAGYIFGIWIMYTIGVQMIQMFGAAIVGRSIWSDEDSDNGSSGLIPRPVAYQLQIWEQLGPIESIQLDGQTITMGRLPSKIKGQVWPLIELISDTLARNQIRSNNGNWFHRGRVRFKPYISPTLDTFYLLARLPVGIESEQLGEPHIIRQIEATIGCPVSPISVGDEFYYSISV